MVRHRLLICERCFESEEENIVKNTVKILKLIIVGRRSYEIHPGYDRVLEVINTKNVNIDSAVLR